MKFILSLFLIIILLLRQAQAGRPKRLSLLGHLFFEYNKRLLRQRTGGACLYMPQNDHCLASFEVIPPPKKVSFSAAKKMKIPFNH